MGDTERHIADLFNDYFFNFGIRIAPEDVVPGARRTIREERSGWAITYRVDRDESGLLSLEFYATNRRTNDRHGWIPGEGEPKLLEALGDFSIGDSEDAAAEFAARNEAVALRLRERGIYPHG